MPLTIFEYIEDYDNAELPEYERNEILEEKVVEYNELYNKSYNPEITVRSYHHHKTRYE
jgi:hypothetical protein